MSESFPDPECNFGVAVEQKLQSIVDKLDDLAKKQEEHTETLQNGLRSEVEQLGEDVKELKDEKESEEEQRRKWKRMVIIRFIEALLALGGGIFLGWLNFT